MHSKRAEAGFSIIEMLIATAIMMVVTAATFGLMNPAQGMFVAQPEVSDMQQRLRIAVDTLKKDLLMAGAGTYSGNNKLGSLGQYVATILPDREGNVTPDPPAPRPIAARSLRATPSRSCTCRQRRLRRRFAIRCLRTRLS
jgi:Tfp pilus assembly protein PilW